MGQWDFPYPIMVSNLGVAASVLFSHMAANVGYITRPTDPSIQGVNYYKRVLPVGLAHAGTLMFGNWVYLYLDMGFIQMLKAFSPVVVLACQVTMGIGRPASTVVVASLLTISVGTCITCAGSAESWSIIGFGMMLISMMMEGVRLSLTQFLLQDLKFNVFEGLYVLAPASAMWLSVATLIVEVPSMLGRGDAFYDGVAELVPVLVLSGTMGVCVNIVSYYLIQLTSSLTLKVITTIRNVGVVFIGIIFFNETVTNTQFVGYTVALLGFLSYQAGMMGLCERHSKRDSESGPTDARVAANNSEASNNNKSDVASVPLLANPGHTSDKV